MPNPVILVRKAASGHLRAAISGLNFARRIDLPRFPVEALQISERQIYGNLLLK